MMQQLLVSLGLISSGGNVTLAALRRAVQLGSLQRSSETHEHLCAKLRDLNTIKTDQVASAFAAVDRMLFIGEMHSAASDADMRALVYSDRPFRNGPFHLSAPSIYATCLEALELRRGLSFLNIGSGTGYLSCIVGQIIGPHAVHQGVEIKPPLVAHARHRAKEFGLGSIAFHAASMDDIDVSSSCAFDRIWVGAAARPAQREHALRLLKVGGIAVGPFEDDDGNQYLEKVIKVVVAASGEEGEEEGKEVSGDEGEAEEGEAAALVAQLRAGTLSKGEYYARARRPGWLLR